MPRRDRTAEFENHLYNEFDEPCPGCGCEWFVDPDDGQMDRTHADDCVYITWMDGLGE